MQEKTHVVTYPDHDGELHIRHSANKLCTGRKIVTINLQYAADEAESIGDTLRRLSRDLARA